MELLPYVIACLFTAAGIWLLKPLALRLGLYDQPGGRKTHEGRVPLVGGLAMLGGFCFALLTLNISLSNYRCLIACAGLLTLTGLLDDFRELSPRARLFVQIIAGICMIVWGKNSLQTLGNLVGLGDIHLGYFAYPVTVFAVLIIINAVNMTDGLDGLCASLTLIEFFYLIFLSRAAPFAPDKVIMTLVLCVLFIFLCFNFPFKTKALVFMGDSGSMLLGFLLVWFCVFLSQPPHAAARPVVFLWIMAMPLLDMSRVVFKRLIRGFSPLKADRGHFHHLLLNKGFSPLETTLILSFFSALSGLIGILGEKYAVRESILFISFLSVWFGVLLV